MTFFSGSKKLYEIIEEIADHLIDNYADWSDGDTTWTTEDPSGDNAKRCLYHSDGLYITLEQINTSRKVHTSGYYAKGLRTYVSDDWDSENHKPAGNQMYSFIQTEGCSGSVQADLATLLFSYYSWVAANGFVLLATPSAHSSDDRQGAFILVWERNTNKLYSDSYTNFYCYNRCAYLNYSYYSGWRTHNVIRPFAFQANGYTSGYERTYYPSRNYGNDKVYYAFPYIHNAQDNSRHIYVPELFLEWASGRGLIDGDVLLVDSKKYLLKRISSPDTTTDLYYGIRYT